MLLPNLHMECQQHKWPENPRFPVLSQVSENCQKNTTLAGPKGGGAWGGRYSKHLKQGIVVRDTETTNWYALESAEAGVAPLTTFPV